MWDFRICSTKTKNLCVATFEENEDTITDLKLNEAKDRLLATSNDGFLAVFDIRRASCTNTESTVSMQSTLNEPASKFKPSLYAMSDNMEEELTSLVIMKNGTKVVVGTQEGIVMLFTWDWFGDCDDRMTQHPCSVSTIIKYSEDVILTGCDDGYVRAVNILPNRVISIINDDADDEDSMPVAKIALKDNLVAFTCNDEMVRIYDVERFEALEEEDVGENPEPAMPSRKKFADEEMEDESDADKEWEDIEDEIDSGSSEEEEEEKEERPANTKTLFYDGESADWAKNKTSIDRKKRQDFFSDL